MCSTWDFRQGPASILGEPGNIPIHIESPLVFLCCGLILPHPQEKNFAIFHCLKWCVLWYNVYTFDSQGLVLFPFQPPLSKRIQNKNNFSLMHPALKNQRYIGFQKYTLYQRFPSLLKNPKVKEVVLHCLSICFLGVLFGKKATSVACVAWSGGGWRMGQGKATW